jgi:tetratricopeptide (TPR) repeat protein
MAVHFDRAGESLFTDSKDAGVQRWPITEDPKTGVLRIGPPQSFGLSAQAPFFGNDPDFALSADGRTVARSPRRGQIVLFDRDNPRPLLVIDSPYLRQASFSPDGRWLATGNWQGRGVKVWDARTGELEKDLDLGETAGTAWPAFSPDGKWLVTGTFQEYRFWEVGSWQKKHGLARGDAGRSIGWIVFSPDGKMMAVLHGMTEVRLVDPATGRDFARLPTQGSPVCFAHDGGQLVTYARGAGAFQVWDLRLIRRQLAAMGLDWDLPPYRPALSDEEFGEGPPKPPGQEFGGGPPKPLRVEVLPAQPLQSPTKLDADVYVERALLLIRLRQYAVNDIWNSHMLNPSLSRRDEVFRAYAQMIERHPTDVELYLQRARVYELLTHWQEAAADYSQAIKLAPDRWDLLVFRGRAYLRTGQREKAAEDYLKASESDPNRGNSLARELATFPEYSSLHPSLAVDLVKRAMQQAPEQTGYWSTLGMAHYRAGNWEESLAALQKSVELRKPGGASEWFFLAMAHWQLGNKAEARTWYDRAVEWMDKNEPGNEILHRFRAEASKLLELNKKK